MVLVVTQFEDARVLCEEANRQKQRFQELAERSPATVNLEVCILLLARYIVCHRSLTYELTLPICSISRMSCLSLWRAATRASAPAWFP